MLGDRDAEMEGSLQTRLNPCFSGRYAGRKPLVTYKTKAGGLNPCFSGRYAGRRMELSHYETVTLS